MVPRALLWLCIALVWSCAVTSVSGECLAYAKTQCKEAVTSVEDATADALEAPELVIYRAALNASVTCFSVVAAAVSDAGNSSAVASALQACNASAEEAQATISAELNSTSTSLAATVANATEACYDAVHSTSVSCVLEELYEILDGIDEKLEKVYKNALKEIESVNSTFITSLEALVAKGLADCEDAVQGAEDILSTLANCSSSSSSSTSTTTSTNSSDCVTNATALAASCALQVDYAECRCAQISYNASSVVNSTVLEHTAACLAAYDAAAKVCSASSQDCHDAVDHAKNEISRVKANANIAIDNAVDVVKDLCGVHRDSAKQVCDELKVKEEDTEADVDELKNALNLYKDSVDITLDRSKTSVKEQVEEIAFKYVILCEDLKML